ncbi:HlyD family secretion protein [Brevibacillus ginsengisoli]|uniref:HlyD family secretion protein n=1 Tax=Brevibacillus ginsengisoli TaxID=363854 RepID=UPI003CFA082B
MNRTLFYFLMTGILAILLTGCSLQKSDDAAYSGMIEADEVPIVAEVSGKVTSLMADEGSTVTKNQVVASLDDQSYQFSVKEAQAALQYASIKVDEAKAGNRNQMIDKALANVQSANAAITTADSRKRQSLANLTRAQDQLTQGEADLNGAKKTLDYQQERLREIASLYQNGAATKKDYDTQQEAVNQAQTAVKRLTSQVEVNRAQVTSAQSDLDAAAGDIEARQAQMRSAQSDLDLMQAGSTDYVIKELIANQQQAAARLDQARLQLNKATIRIPVNGTILRKNVTEGEVVKPGTPLFTMMKEGKLKLTMYIPEAELGRVKVNQTVHIQVDAYPDKTFTGKISAISQKAEFTPRNIQTKDERTKMVFAVTVQIQEGLDQLKPGMPADVYLMDGVGK